MVRRVDSGEQFVYLQATRGTQPRDHVYPEDMHANIWIMLRPQTVKDVFHEVRAITAEDTRFFHNNIKTLNLIPAVMYAQMAKRAGVYETILYRKPDRVTECAHANVHILNRDGVFQTAPTDELIARASDPCLPCPRRGGVRDALYADRPDAGAGSDYFLLQRLRSALRGD